MLYKQGTITAQISYITGKVKQTNGKENVIIHNYHDIADKTAGTKSLRLMGEETHDVTHTTVFG